MSTARVQALVWPSIYVGMALLMVGLWSWRTAPGVGIALSAIGGVLVGLGLVLIWVRSRREEPAPTPGRTPPQAPPHTPPHTPPQTPPR